MEICPDVARKKQIRKLDRQLIYMLEIPKNLTATMSAQDCQCSVVLFSLDSAMIPSMLESLLV